MEESGPMPNADRLTGLDASFLALESDGAHMHVGSVLVLDGPAPSYDELVAAIAARLHLVPRYRQQLAFPPFGVTRPVWVDDPHFNARYHLRHTGAARARRARPSCGALAGRVFSQQLDRDKPLWEIWLVDRVRRRPLRADLQDAPRAGRRGLGRRHHRRVLFDLEAGAAPERDPAPLWSAAAGAEPRRAVRRARWSGCASPCAARAVAALAPPRPRGQPGPGGRPRAWRRWLAAGVAGAPPSPLNVRDRPAPPVRVGAMPTWPLQGDQGRAGRNGQRRRADGRHGRAAGAADPPRPRSRGDRAQGDGARSRCARSPSGARSATAWPRCTRRCRWSWPTRWSASRTSTRRWRGSRSPARPWARRRSPGWPTSPRRPILDQAARLQTRQRFFNLTVTNVPGPQFPLYLLGRRLREFYPQVPLVLNTALGIAIMSYDGHLFFGLLGDYDALPDLDEVADDLDRAIAELAAGGGRDSAAGPPGAAPARAAPPVRRSPPGADRAGRGRAGLGGLLALSSCSRRATRRRLDRERPGRLQPDHGNAAARGGRHIPSAAPAGEPPTSGPHHVVNVGATAGLSDDQLLTALALGNVVIALRRRIARRPRCGGCSGRAGPFDAGARGRRAGGHPRPQAGRGRQRSRCLAAAAARRRTRPTAVTGLRGRLAGAGAGLARHDGRGVRRLVGVGGCPSRSIDRVHAPSARDRPRPTRARIERSV